MNIPCLMYYTPVQFVNVFYFVQVMTVGQKVFFEYHGNNYSFTVSQAAFESHQKSNYRGMISDDTYIVFETSHDSGIKASFPFCF